MTDVPYWGEICALLSPLAWSIAVILFRKTGEQVSPLVLNFFKSVVAVVGFAGLLVVTGEVAPEGTPNSAYALLLFSGLIGVAIAVDDMNSVREVLGKR